MELLRLVQSQVRLGAPLPWGVRDEAGVLLLARGHVFVDDGQLQALLRRGAYADLEEVKAAARAAQPREARPANLFDLWEKTLWRLDRLLKSLAEPGFPARIDEFAGSLVALIERDPDIGIFLSVRKDRPRMLLYGLTHSLHTALLCCLMARRLGWSAARTQSLVKAALTMNIAMLELQGRLAAQGVPAMPPQLERVARHPQQAVDLLAAAGIDDAEWLQAVAEHHECPGGGGYPSGMRDPCEMAWALRLADVLMARITPRGSRPAISMQEAARHVFREDGGGPLAMAIVKELGIYPPGDFVQLKSGERAVVVRRGDSASTPIAASITDRSGMPVVHTTRRDTACQEFAIVAALPDKSLAARLLPERLYGLPA
jgi:hypothetical protein